MNIQKIDTERLVLYKLSLNDAQFIYELVNSAAWIKNIGDRDVRSIEDAQNYIQKIIDNPNDVSYWTVKIKDTLLPVGIITLLKRDYLEHPDIGFAFLPQHTKRGYAYEATKAVLDQVTESKLQQNVLAITIEGNANSIRLLEKLGLQFEKLIEHEDESLLLYSLKTS